MLSLNVKNILANRTEKKRNLLTFPLKTGKITRKRNLKSIRDQQTALGRIRLGCTTAFGSLWEERTGMPPWHRGSSSLWGFQRCPRVATALLPPHEPHFGTRGSTVAGYRAEAIHSWGQLDPSRAAGGGPLQL